MTLLNNWKRVLEGETVSFRPRGNSMRGLVSNGDLVTVSPCNDSSLEPGDIVLVKVKSNVYLHKVLSIDANRALIGNNRGRVNGWTPLSQIAGICTSVEGASRPRLLGKLKN